MSQVSRWGKEGKKQQMAESLKVRNRLPPYPQLPGEREGPVSFCLWGGSIFNVIPRKELCSAPGRDHFACQGNIRVSSGEQDHPASFKGGSSLGPQREGGIRLLPSSNLLQPSADALSTATSQSSRGKNGPAFKDKGADRRNRQT